MPATFTKFPSSLCGPYDSIRLSGDHVDWEVELVAIVGRQCDNVPLDQAWQHVGALTIGQDISDRVVQQAAGAQFSLAKSFRQTTDRSVRWR
jgi:2-keto-4-pentenoate hydratase/2-oxohepta-3-ene-1,7-dioic acid hydratase in catechol pathway